jgi:hypothetical protein
MLKSSLPLSPLQRTPAVTLGIAPGSFGIVMPGNSGFGSELAIFTPTGQRPGSGGQAQLEHPVPGRCQGKLEAGAGVGYFFPMKTGAIVHRRYM